MHGLVGRDPDYGGEPDQPGPHSRQKGLAKRRLAELTAEENDSWLADKTKTLSTVTLQHLLPILRHGIRRARRATSSSACLRCCATYRRDRTARPAVQVLDTGAGRKTAPSSGDNPTMNAYALTGARTEELRGALTWSRVNSTGPADHRALETVRAHGDTKTSKSRRTLELQ